MACLLVAPVAEARSYNCANPDSRPNGKWSLGDETMMRQLVDDISSQGFGKPKHFKFRFCGTYEDSVQVIMVGAQEIVDDKPVCNSPDNYAVFYDPKKRTFSALVTGIDMCDSAK